MRIALFLLVSIHSFVSFAADVEVHFRFNYEVHPPDVAVGLLGSMNNWGLPPDGEYLVFEDPDGDSIWEGSILLEEDTYVYKLVSLTSTDPEMNSSYPDVTGWYPDPINPLTDGSAYNNSIIHVTDPMIYYLLPMDGSEVEEERPAISANVAAGMTTGLDLETLTLTLDGNDITTQSTFDSTTGLISYIPSSDLSMGTHTISVSVSNTPGTEVSLASTFSIVQGPPRMDYRFVLDRWSPNYELPTDVHRVQIAGDFNNWNPSTARLADEDGDGVWEGFIRFAIGESFLYRYSVIDTSEAGTLWIPDPDNPDLELRDPGDWYVSSGQANPVGTPKIIDRDHFQGSILEPGTEGATFRIAMLPGDWGNELIPGSVEVELDDVPLTTQTDVAGDSVNLTITLPVVEEGYHRVFVLVRDDLNRTATSTLSFGAYEHDTGYHWVDAVEDDTGPGRYRYPDDVTDHSADLLAVHLGSSTRLLPTMFHADIDLETIDERTAVGFLISAAAAGPPEPLPGNLDIYGHPWVGQGIFIWLVPPNSTYYDDSIHNRLILDIDPYSVGAPVNINPYPEDTGRFEISLPLDVIEYYAGDYATAWNYLVVSTLFQDDGFEMEPANGGWPDEIDPDIYDVAFFPDGKSQERILGSWISTGDPGGPRSVRLTRHNRGLAALPPDSIQGLPDPGPEIIFYSAGAVRRWRDFTITGSVADETATSGMFYHGRTTWPVDLEQGTFSVPVELNNGANYVGLEVTDDNELTSKIWARYDCIPDQIPKARIEATVENSTITLDGTSSFHPDNLDIASYIWSTEPDNPAPVTIQGSTSQIAFATLPDMQGTYSFRLTVSDGSRLGSAVTTILSDDTGIHPLEPDAFPSWAAQDLVYEIYPVSYSNESTLNAITDDLQRIANLGIGTVWLTPVFTGPEAHGYAITDYFAVNPALGSPEELCCLIEYSHAGGMKVILDLVINHTSISHPFMIDAMRYGENSIYRDYYLWNPDGSYQSYWTDLPNLNYGNPEVWRHFLLASNYWVENFDIDGYRCDVAWGIQERNPEFWVAWRDSLKEISDDLLLLAEAGVDVPGIFDGRFDAAYDWTFMHTMKDLLRGNVPPLMLHQYIQSFVGMDPIAFRFIENHDETRFVNEFGDMRTRLAAGLLYTLPGLPLLYAGQEVGELSQRYYIDWTDPLNLQPHYRALGAIREALGVFRTGDYRWVANSDPGSVYSFARRYGDERVFVVANCGNLPRTVSVSLPVEEWDLPTGDEWILSELLSGSHTSYQTEDLDSLLIELEPHEIMITVVADSIVADTGEEPILPGRLTIDSPAPNPSSGRVRLTFSLPGPDAVEIDLYDLGGRLQGKILPKTTFDAGNHELEWKNGNLSPGLYFIVFRANNLMKTHRLVLLKH